MLFHHVREIRREAHVRPGGISRPVVGVGEEAHLVQVFEIHRLHLHRDLAPAHRKTRCDVLERHPPAEIHPVDEDVDLVFVGLMSSDASHEQGGAPVVEAAFVAVDVVREADAEFFVEVGVEKNVPSLAHEFLDLVQMSAQAVLGEERLRLGAVEKKAVGRPERKNGEAPVVFAEERLRIPFARRIQNEPPASPVVVDLHVIQAFQSQHFENALPHAELNLLL